MARYVESDFGGKRFSDFIRLAICHYINPLSANVEYPPHDSWTAVIPDSVKIINKFWHFHVELEISYKGVYKTLKVVWSIPEIVSQSNFQYKKKTTTKGSSILRETLLKKRYFPSLYQCNSISIFVFSEK